MFETIRRFLAALTEGRSATARFDEGDYRLAAAALLVHTAAIDGALSPVEQERLHRLVKERFRLDDGATRELLREATEAEHEAVDLYQFTSLLNRTLDEAGRSRIVEMMWQVVYADGQVSEFEDNLIWRAADLLHVPARVRLELRRRVAAGLGHAAAPSADARDA
jgi:uncharacterized tellurite resistance protein B-like protein